MGLDYTSGCVNFRDFGGYINILAEEKLLPEGILYRGGSIDYIKGLEEIESVKSIINLRNGADYDEFKINYYHFPMSNKIEKYDTSQKEVQFWLNSILSIFEDESLEYPLLIHCLSGKDRTGIVVASLLLILGINQNYIEEEYLLSEGDVRRELIQSSLEGMKNVETYFKKLDLDKIRRNILKLVK